MRKRSLFDHEALDEAALVRLAQAAPPRTHTVTIAQMKFGPSPEGVRVGDTIVWVNNDPFRHTATSRQSGFDIDLPPRGGAARSS